MLKLYIISRKIVYRILKKKSIRICYKGILDNLMILQFDKIGKIVKIKVVSISD